MSRNFVGAAAVALAAAALLGACDKTKAPSPAIAAAAVDASAPAPAAAARPATLSDAREPAATAQIEEASADSPQEVRVPHVMKEGETGLDSLQPLQGKYRWDGVDYVQDGVLAERLKTLMGHQYDTLLKNLQTLGPLEPSAGLLYVMGNRQHQGGEEMAAVVIDPVRNGLRVWLLSEGKQTVFTDVDGADIPWPSAVQSMLRNIVATH
ncbi:MULTISPECIES: hypothetical protein [Comamonas]|uniref:hypothetical protein n=1 Tax=Comamonas TaxID=283 RepID=UPI0012C0AD1A|nr:MULTISPECIES: hypothetical protein [Comamonas]MDR3064561.1 hypothetical protein [Comamonas sp.]MEB5964308.1 hypothetical protein [Comamonas testosteroni]MPS91685.1 hypothetical protein [Comamonas sp.]